jgi:hypothetical protein
MTFEEMAWEFVEVFEDLDSEQINEMLAKNVPFETIEFIAKYAQDYGEAENLTGRTLDRLPNLMLIGYLLRVLEERLEPTKLSDV